MMNLIRSNIYCFYCTTIFKITVIYNADVYIRIISFINNVLYNIYNFNIIIFFITKWFLFYFYFLALTVMKMGRMLISTKIINQSKNSLNRLNFQFSFKMSWLKPVKPVPNMPCCLLYEPFSVHCSFMA